MFGFFPFHTKIFLGVFSVIGLMVPITDLISDTLGRFFVSWLVFYLFKCIDMCKLQLFLAQKFESGLLIMY